MRKLSLKVFTLAILFLGFTIPTQAAEPGLLFSDLTDGPITGWEGSPTKGAAVSVYVRDIDSSRGTSYITVGGVNLTNDTDYAEWGATTNPIVPLGMKRVTFFLNSSMTTGGAYPNTTITLTTSEGVSETIPFHTRELGVNHIYFIDNVNGNTSNNGLTVATAKRYPAWFRGNAIAGDILYLKDSGIKYTDHDNDTSDYTYSYGSIFTFSKQWHGTEQNFNNGTEGHSITVSSYPGDDVKLEAIGDDNTGPSRVIKYVYKPLEYWTFSKLSMNAHYPVAAHYSVVTPYGTHTQDFRLINLDITTPYYNNTRNNGHVSSGQGMVLTGGNGSGDTFVLGCYLHDIAMDLRGQEPFDPDGYRSYFIYINGYGTYNGFELGWNEMGWVNSRGVQFFGHDEGDRVDNLYVHDNWIHDTGRQNLVFGGEGGSVDYSFAQDVYIYNNILEKGGTGDVVLQMGGQYGNGKFGGNYYVYNNILDTSNNDQYPAILVGKDLDSLEFKNNIILGVPNTWSYYTYFPNTYAEFIGDLTPVASNNVYYGAGAGTKPDWDSSTLSNNDPVFISNDRTNFLDFQLQASSPAKDAGTSWATAIKDFLNISRPQGSAYDIGAYEYQETAAVIRADVDQSSSINSTDALLTLRNSLGLDMSSTNWQVSATTGDVNCDDSSSSTDALLILRESLGLDMSGTGWCG